MKTIDLQNEPLSADQLLALASSERLLKILKGGKQFLLQETDDFEAEAAELGTSEEFHRGEVLSLVDDHELMGDAAPANVAQGLDYDGAGAHQVVAAAMLVAHV